MILIIVNLLSDIS